MARLCLCGPCPETTTTACESCPSGMLLQWKVSAPGVTDSTCAGCSSFGNFEILNWRISCTFDNDSWGLGCSSPTIICGGINYCIGWRLIGLWVPPAHWELQAVLVREGGVSYISLQTYDCGADDFDCFTGGVFDINLPINLVYTCITFPSTVTVSPV